MKITAKLTIIAVTVLCLAATSFAGKKNRKLTVGAYISSAKIEIVSGEMERYETAIVYLDSLFKNYGPHAEGLHLMSQIMDSVTFRRSARRNVCCLVRRKPEGTGGGAS